MNQANRVILWLFIPPSTVIKIPFLAPQKNNAVETKPGRGLFMKVMQNYFQLLSAFRCRRNRVSSQPINPMGVCISKAHIYGSLFHLIFEHFDDVIFMLNKSVHHEKKIESIC